MAKAKKTAEVVAPEVAAETTAAEQVVDAAAEAQEEATEEVVEATKEAAAEEAATEEAKKRNRNYAQTAITLEDLARLSHLKAHIKEVHKVAVSNQIIIQAALDCLAHDANMKAFLESLVNKSTDKARERDLKKLAELQAKLGVAPEATAANAA